MTNRFIATLVFTGLLVGCQTTPSIPPEAQRCESPRPQVCTMDFRPACGFSSENISKTFSNTCNACSHEEVLWVIPGECAK